MIGGIILAAGNSRRFGSDKRRSLLFSGETLLEATIRKALTCLPAILVVLRNGDQAFAAQLMAGINDSRVRYYLAPDSAQGMAHSLANSVGQVQNWEAALVMLGDMPFLETHTIKQILDAYASEVNRGTNPAPIVVPCLGAKFGHPVLFSQHYFRAITLLTGDRGARPIIDAHPEYLVKLAVTDDGVLLDVDRPADLT